MRLHRWLALAMVSCALSAWAQDLAVSASAHERKSGHVGFGFLGASQVLGAQDNVGPFEFRRTTVPLLGVRWWFDKSRVGLELGAGVMVRGDGGASVEFLTHAALPISVLSARYAIVFVAPEARFGFSYLSKDITASTWSLRLRAGVEVFFGFIGLENLSFEVSVGAGVTHERHSTAVFTPLVGRTSAEQLFTRFGTSLLGDPLEVISSSVALRYYF